MAEFLLIHGSCHGAWCWRDVIPALASLGHHARAIDLPAHGQDATPAAEATLDLYADTILDALAAPAIVVGHSAAGYAITLAAERAPDKVRSLVYLCAYVPAPGMSMIDMRRAGPRQPLKGAVHVAPDGVTYTVDPARAPGTFFHDCPAGAIAYALPLLCPEPILPQSTVLPPLRRWHEVDAHYIRCADDRTIPPEYQDAMSARFAPGHVTDLPSGHSPFFSMPDGLARRLGEIAGAKPPRT